MKAKLVKESLSSKITAYHTTYDDIQQLRDRPIWLAPSLELANVYYDNQVYDNGDAPFIYEVIFSGIILSEDQLESECNKIGIDYFDLNTDLVSNPDESEANSIIQPLRELCDAFYMSDYDPRDSQKDIESICLINSNAVISLNKIK